jgi:hypothetical protein
MTGSERRFSIAQMASYFVFAVAVIGVLVGLFGVVLFYPLFGLLGIGVKTSPLGVPGTVAIMIALGVLALLSIRRPRLSAAGIIVLGLVGFMFGGVLSQWISIAAIIGAVVIVLGNRKRAGTAST